MKTFYLIGSPVSHSLSPLMHNTAFRKLKLPYRYEAIEVRASQLPEAAETLRRPDVGGFNVTMPLKEAILEYLDEVSREAEIIGAVNTVVNVGGRLAGYNTDVAGVRVALEKAGVEARRAVVLGAGGAAKAVVYCLAELGAEVTVLNRTLARARRLAERMPATPAELSRRSLREHIPRADLVVNATPVGMDGESTLVDRSLLRRHQAVLDLVYRPLKTPLLREAEAAGAKPIPGVEVLVAQGAEAFRIWTGFEPPVDDMMKAVVAELESSS